MKKAYQKYSKTRIPWLQFMPDHWDDVKVKFLFRERAEKGFPEEPLLAATQTQGVVPKELYENRTVTAQKDFHLLKLVKVGDFVISLRSFQGGIEYAYYRGIISPAYTVMKPLPEVFGGYFRYLFKSKHFVDDLTTYVTGIREGQNIDYSEFRDSFQPLPPLPEQRQIAAFLDHKCALIDTFIQKKTRLIELLKEQKQAIINKAVTKGIDPNVRLKSSGIDWLGDIPEHWEVKKLKYLGNSFIGVTYSPDELTDKTNGVLVLRSSNIQDGKLDFGDSVYIKREKEIPEKQITRAQDILICSRNGSAKLVGKNASIEGDAIGQTFGAFMTIFRSPNNSYLKVIFDSELFSSQTGLFSTSTINQLTKNILENIQVPFPVDAEEREKIVSFISEEVKRGELTISQVEREIELIQEYRTTLIAEAVTGKIDVRDWQPKQVAEETEQTLNQVKAYGSN